MAETNLLTPKPDFVMFGGDLAQLGMKEELDHGAEMLSKLGGELHCVMGEHDYYLDLGEYGSKLFGRLREQAPGPTMGASCSRIRVW